MWGNDFATIPTSTSGRPSALPDLADRRARPVRVDHRDAAGPLVAVAREHHVVDVLAAGRLDVDVDIRQLVAHRVQEALEREVVPERVDVGDPEQVAHERAGGAPAARHVDPHRTDVRDDVGDREEERRVAHLSDHRELEVDPVAQTLVLGHPPVVHAEPAALGEDRVGAPPRRRGEVREMDLLEAEVEPACLGDLDRGVAEVGSLGEEQTHRLGRLQPSFGVPARDVVGGDRDDLAHALERVCEERVLGHEVADRVRGHRADLRAVGEAVRMLPSPSETFT